MDPPIFTQAMLACARLGCITLLKEQLRKGFRNYSSFLVQPGICDITTILEKDAHVGRLPGATPGPLQVTYPASSAYQM
jgi:hypothetical protein